MLLTKLLHFDNHLQTIVRYSNGHLCRIRLQLNKERWFWLKIQLFLYQKKVSPPLDRKKDRKDHPDKLFELFS